MELPEPEEPEELRESVPGIHGIVVEQASSPDTSLCVHQEGSSSDLFIQSDEYKPLMAALRSARDFMVRKGRWDAEVVGGDSKGPLNVLFTKTIEGVVKDHWIQIGVDYGGSTGLIKTDKHPQGMVSRFNREQLTEIRDRLNEILGDN